MKTTASQIRCPACQGPLVPTELHCTNCDIHVSGRFTTNEFASLSEDDLHFLRIFIHCEGRIRDMESALGVSYPTIKARLARLKESLAEGPPEAAPMPQAADPVAEALHQLDQGEITFEEAMKRIKDLRGDAS